MNSFDDIFDAPQSRSSRSDQPFDKAAWGERKQAERQAVYDLADTTAMAVAADGGKFQQYLDVQARFGRYTATNALLILAQMPQATKVKDFDGWKDSGASIKKATAKRALKTTISELGISKAKLSRDSGISATTVGVAIRGDAVAVETAEAISKALEGEFSDFFKLQESKVPLSDKTILEHHRLISTILAQAEKEMLLPYNPAAKATPPRAKKAKPDYYQPDEIDDILAALEKAPLKWQTITYLLIDTGARRGEIMGLKWENLNLDTGLVIIDHALLYTKSKGVFEGDTKTDNTRAMVLAPQTMTLLKKWHTEYLRLKMKNGDRWINNGYIFTQDDGRPMHPDSITDWLGEFSKKHDLPHIHPHAFRHTAASTMIANGVDIVTTAGELGHASPSTTANIYAHQIAVAKAKAANVRAGVFSGRDSKPKKKRA